MDSHAIQREPVMGPKLKRLNARTIFSFVASVSSNFANSLPGIRGRMGFRGDCIGVLGFLSTISATGVTIHGMRPENALVVT